jgi:hypothetical protein
LSAVVETTVENPIAETAVGDEFGKEPGNTADTANKIAGNNVRMESEFDPRLRFLFITSFSVFCLKELRLGTLNGKVHIPFAVIDSVDNADSAFGVGHSFGEGLDFIDTEDEVADIPKS